MSNITLLKHQIDGYCLHMDYDKEFLKNNSNIIKSASVVKIISEFTCNTKNLVQTFVTSRIIHF